MMADVVIRSASLDDVDALAGLTQQLGYESNPAAARERLMRVLGLDEHAVFVAVARGTVAGWMHVFISHSLESDDFAEIRGLVVADGFRSAGIGARLVETGEQWARTQRVGRMRVRSNIVRTDARRFYERHGYSVMKTQNVFDKAL